MPLKRLLRFVPLCLAVIGPLSLGCSGGSGLPATFPVRGVVTYKGKPVEGASIAFLAPGAPAPAVGTTDAEGRFVLTTFKEDDGAVAGRHAVTVKKYDFEAPQPASTEASPEAIEAAMKQGAEQAKEALKKGSILPERYADRRKTDLEVEIKDGENDVTLDLKD